MDIEHIDNRNIKLRLLLKHHQKFMHYNLSLIAMSSDGSQQKKYFFSAILAFAMGSNFLDTTTTKCGKEEVEI